MSFDLQEINAFCKILLKYARAKPTHLKFDHWSPYKEALNIDNHLRFLTNDAMHNYIQAVADAATYLLNKDEVSVSRQAFMDQHAHHLNTIANKHFPHRNIPPLQEHHELHPQDTSRPQAFFEQAKDTYKNVKKKAGHAILGPIDRHIHSEVTKFCISRAFQELENYLQFLQDDTRDHTFFCCINLKEDRKVAALQALISSIKSANSMKKIREILTEFYEEAGKSVSTDNGVTYHRSHYEIVNTGQNIFTKVFGKRTTSLEKVDAVYNLAFLDQHLDNNDETKPLLRINY
jgi:hypothetical protein